jgi:hypothetical protein
VSQPTAGETPEERVARLQHELDQAKIDDLQKQLAAAQEAAGMHPPTPADQLPPRRRISVVKNGVRVFDNADIADLARRFGDSGAGIAAPVDTNLAPAPRRVPWRFRAAVLPWSWWTVWTMFMISITPIALYIVLPISGAIAAAAGFVGIVAVRLVRNRTRLALLKWGAVATVVDTDVKGVGTYYSGTTYQNMRLAQAHGWQVDRRRYSGPGTTTEITYELNGQRNNLTLHGREYDNGVILADTRHPERALCVSSFPYDLERDSSGNWVGGLTRRVAIGSALMTVLLLGWVVALVTVYLKQS